MAASALMSYADGRNRFSIENRCALLGRFPEIPDKPSDTSKKCQPCENRLVDPVGKTAGWRANQPSLAFAELWLVLLKRVWFY